MEASNAKAMREALNEIQLVCYKAGITIGYDVACGIIKSKSRAALYAPPRNCDLFDTKDKAREAFQKLRGHRILADVSLWDDRDEIEALFDWLFAKPKGETK